MMDATDGISVLRPVLAEKPWGGRRLADFGMSLPLESRIGEALISAGGSTISAGVDQGHTLAEVVMDHRQDAAARTAADQFALFPLLVKLIDARENLSIQVHPDDRRAVPQGQPGKTEAWHVLGARPGSVLYVGLDPAVTADQFLAAASRLDGSSAGLLRRIPAQPGTTILLPAGTVHALGAGVMVYEIQQPSDITYRLDDWGRVDANGQPREMHIEAGAQAMDARLRPDLIPQIELPASAGRRHLLVACDNFALERIALTGGARWSIPPHNGPQVITFLSGTARIGEHELRAGESVVAWPSAGPRELHARQPMVALRGWVPDLVREVARYATIPGVNMTDLSRMSGPLPDVRRVLEARERASI